MNEVQVNSQGNVQSVDFTSQEPMQPQRSSQTEMMVTRQAQEVQVAMLAAKKFPRDQVVAYNNIMRACQRRKLAESSMYEFPRGNEKITGPSIRLAEAIAQNWGNIDFGFMELEQRNGASQVMAYAWDLETNSRQTKLFSVPHIRHTRKGDYPLTDPRDIYEAVANQAARRVRACILGIIPSDVVEAAVDRCNKTLREGYEEPLVDRVRKKGYKYFVQLDDDYPKIDYRYVKDGKLKAKPVSDFDKLFEAMCKFMEPEAISCVAFAVAGDYIGGANGRYRDGLYRNARNSFFCRTDRPFEFLGRINEDVTTPAVNNMLGRLFFTFMGVQVTLYDHEKNKGGSTEQYREVNLYWNYFYPVLYVPSAISVAYGKTGFIKRVRWNNLLPQIINEKWRKGYEK